ncbi:MAG: aminopeptidase P family protein [Phycisphaerae bacterium]|nr:aminopeptidase P family protein [Phycisphaerae bacterium]
MNIGDGFPVRDFVARRDRVLSSLDGAIGLVFAGDGPPPLSGFWEPDWNFYYLTGIRDEPGAVVLFDPRAEDPLRRCVLFLKPRNPEVEAWDGYRDPISTALKAQTGFDTVMRTTALPRTLTTIARRRGVLACLHPFAVYDGPASPDLALFRKVVERSVGISIKDQTNLLPSLRAVKSAREVREMERAVRASASGYRAAMRSIRPGMPEREIQRVVEEGFRAGGATGTGYNSIVGAGLNSTVLHYMANSGVAKAGDLVLIDAGARVGGYTADVTRTLPVSGRFAADQREVYEVVLAALEAGIRACRPGVHMAAVDAAARKVIDRAGYADFFIHGIGHQLGIEVHDVTPDGPLKPGMIVTIEPGIYIPDQRLGIRIEDDVLLTRQGPRVLTSEIPKTVRAIEAAMKRR